MAADGSDTLRHPVHYMLSNYVGSASTVDQEQCLPALQLAWEEIAWAVWAFQSYILVQVRNEYIGQLASHVLGLRAWSSLGVLGSTLSAGGAVSVALFSLLGQHLLSLSETEGQGKGGNSTIP